MIDNACDLSDCLSNGVGVGIGVASGGVGFWGRLAVEVAIRTRIRVAADACDSWPIAPGNRRDRNGARLQLAGPARGRAAADFRLVQLSAPGFLPSWEWTCPAYDPALPTEVGAHRHGLEPVSWNVDPATATNRQP